MSPEFIWDMAAKHLRGVLFGKAGCKMRLESVLGDDAPNGFHDAEIERLTLDYGAMEAVIDCSIWIGNLESPEEPVREAYRRGRLTFIGLQYCVIEPPSPSYPYQESGGLWVANDGPVGSDGVSGENLPPTRPDVGFTHGFFVNDWNAFIYVSAKDARFEWTE